MSTFLLIRHAATDALGRHLSGRTPGVFLNSDGRVQAAQLAQFLADKPLHAVFSSPLERALQTASLIAAPHRLPVTHAPALNEIDFGLWTGRSFADLEPDPLWSRFNLARSFNSPPQGETFSAVQDRVLTFIRHIADQSPVPAAPVALVTHSDVIKTLLLAILSAPAQAIHQLEVSPASISTIEVGPHLPRVLSINRLP